MDAPFASRNLANDNFLVVAARGRQGGRGEERADGPFCEVNVGITKGERSEAGPYAVFGSASSGNSKDVNVVMRRMPWGGRRQSTTGARRGWQRTLRRWRD